VLRSIQRQKVFDLPLLKVLRYALFVTTRRIHRKPPSFHSRRRTDDVFAHGFAILTWWSVFHISPKCFLSLA
jgi:hypothetical protein